jgi:hypothetical protein
MALLSYRFSGFRNTILFVLWVLFTVCFAIHEAQAQTNPAMDAVELQVKAAYLYKFGSYVEWPEKTFANPDSPIVIGVLNADALAGELSKMIVGRTVNGHPVTVRKLKQDESTNGVNILFIGRDNKIREAELIASVRGKSTLIVTDAEGALTLGSMINFVLVDGKVRFEVAPKTASLGFLNISARLLAAAYKVVTGAS